MKQIEWPLGYVLNLMRSFVVNVPCACTKIPGGACWPCLMKGALREYDAQAAAESERTTASAQNAANVQTETNL